MTAALAVSRGIDRLSHWAGIAASWLVLLACLISATNAGSRYLFSVSSNACLEIQWQMFAGIFLLGTACVLKLNEHVRVDLLYGSQSERAKLWTDVVGFTSSFFRRSSSSTSGGPSSSTASSRARCPPTPGV